MEDLRVICNEEKSFNIGGQEIKLKGLSIYDLNIALQKIVEDKAINKLKRVYGEPLPSTALEQIPEGADLEQKVEEYLWTVEGIVNCLCIAANKVEGQNFTPADIGKTLTITTLTENSEISNAMLHVLGIESVEEDETNPFEEALKKK